MKPAAFDYIAPSSLEQALELLARYGEDAKIIAGGQTLGPMLNMRMLTPGVLVDINALPELQGYRAGGGGLTLGALTRQSSLEDDAGLARVQPLVAAAIPHIAHRAIRNRGTVGGSLAHADPAAEWGALVQALDGEMIVAGHGVEQRTIAADAFFDGLLTTAIEADELLVGVRLPPWRAGSGWSFREFSRRHGDFALAGVACRLVLDASGRCTEAALGLIGLGDRPLRARAAEALMIGEPGGGELYRAGAARAAQALDPLDDIHASAAFRRHLARVLVEDALTEAAQRCVAE